MAQIGIKELLEAGVHFGHQTRRWNPKMRRFIFGERDGIYIIDLLQTEALLQDARQFASERLASRRDGPVRRDQEAGPGRDPGDGRRGRHAVRQPPLAGRPADELPDDLAADQAPARPRALRDRGPAAAAADARADGGAGRPREAARQPRWGQEHAARPRRGVRDRPQDRGDRGARGTAPADPDHRPGRHQLRSRGDRLRDPRQRRRDPLVRGDHERDRRRRRPGPRGLPRRGGGRAARARAPGGRGAGPPRGRGAGAPRGRGAGASRGRGAGPAEAEEQARARPRSTPGRPARRPPRSRPSRQAAPRSRPSRRPRPPSRRNRRRPRAAGGSRRLRPPSRRSRRPPPHSRRSRAPAAATSRGRPTDACGRTAGGADARGRGAGGADACGRTAGGADACGRGAAHGGPATSRACRTGAAARARGSDRARRLRRPTRSEEEQA